MTGKGNGAAATSCLVNPFNANRLTGITQGSAQVAFTYDAASRRSTLTLPNGIVATYSYDVANQLTGISYANGSTNRMLCHSHSFSQASVGPKSA